MIIIVIYNRIDFIQEVKKIKKYQFQKSLFKNTKYSLNVLNNYFAFTINHDFY